MDGGSVILIQQLGQGGGGTGRHGSGVDLDPAALRAALPTPQEASWP